MAMTCLGECGEALFSTCRLIPRVGRRLSNFPSQSVLKRNEKLENPSATSEYLDQCSSSIDVIGHNEPLCINGLTHVHRVRRIICHDRFLSVNGSECLCIDDFGDQEADHLRDQLNKHCPTVNGHHGEFDSRAGLRNFRAEHFAPGVVHFRPSSVGPSFAAAEYDAQGFVS